MKFHLTLDGKNAACGAVTNRPDTFLYDKSGFAGHYASEYRCKKCEKIFNEMKKYDTVDYEDARSHLTGVFDSRNNPKLKDASFTKEDVEGLAVILHNLREKHGDPLDIWESNAVSDYTLNLESSYEMKMEKGGKSGKKKNIWEALDFENIEQYYDYIHESKVNGNHSQVRDMTDDQRRGFFRYARENGYDETVNWINEKMEKGGKAGAKKEKSFAGEKIGSYLPIFSGFYNTIFQADEEMVIEHPYKYDDYDFDYEGYQQDVAKECVKQVEEWLEDFDIKVKFEELISPREYNFSNDSINVEYALGKDSMKKILDYLEENKEAFSEYIKKRYTSRSGFISSYSNDANEWIKDLKDESSLHHKLGSVLEFILENEGHDEHDLYDAISGSVYLSGELKKEVKDNQEYIENYAKEHYKDKSQAEIAEAVMKHFNSEGIDYSEKTVRKIIKETFSEVEDKSMKMFERGGKTGKKKGAKKYTDKFEEFYNWGERIGYARDFGHVELSDVKGKDEMEVPLILVAKITDMYDATGDEQFKEQPFAVSFEISPRPDMIDKKHYEGVLAMSGLADDYTADDYDALFTDYIEGYAGGIPLNQEEFNKRFKDEDEAEKFIMSKEINDKLSAVSGMIGFYLDGRINRAGNSRWGYLAHMVDDSKDWMEMYAKGGKIMSGLKSFFESYANDGGLVFGGYFGGGNKMEKGGRASKDGDRHAYYIKAWKKEESYNENKKPDLEEKKSLNWDEAHERQMNLEERFYAVGIFAKKDNREVSISLGEVMGKGGKVKV